MRDTKLRKRVGILEDAMEKFYESIIECDECGQLIFKRHKNAKKVIKTYPNMYGDECEECITKYLCKKCRAKYTKKTKKITKK